jgi:uncharacterized membrane protein YphA (DoxX/SURF4 family)
LTHFIDLSGSRILFSQLSKSQLFLAFIFLMMLRIVVGFHFYKEGTAKLKSGTFTSKGFLSSAKGPLAPYFKQMLDDPDGMQKLCVQESVGADGTRSYSLDPEFTFVLWDNFLDEATGYYGFGSEELQEEIAQRRETLATRIAEAREDKDTSVNTVELESQRAVDEANILRIRNQPKRVEEIFENHKQELIDLLSINEVELISHFATSDRLDGFERDGENRGQVALYVESLRQQVDSIQDDRKKKLNGWTADVTGIWESLEGQINRLAVDEQAARPMYEMHRHFDQENSFIKWVDRIIPWFDTIVGVLLIIGLFSRFASLAAAMFLVSVILTQPPWVPGTAPTYFYFIELMALLVIFATSAGRLGGLDYFLSLPKTAQPEIEG